MTSYRLTREAEEDLIDIWEYTDERWGTEQADRYVNGLASCFGALDELPTHHCSDLLPEAEAKIRFCRHESHYVFFRSTSDGIEVLTVIHAARQGAVEDFLARFE